MRHSLPRLRERPPPPECMAMISGNSSFSIRHRIPHTAEGSPLKNSFDRPLTAAARWQDRSTLVRISLAGVAAALTFFLAAHAALAQAPGRVTGTVLAEGGQLVPSAQVVVVGTTLGA